MAGPCKTSGIPSGDQSYESCIEEGEEIQTIDIYIKDTLFDNIIAENLTQSGEREGYPGIGGFQNTKQVKSEKIYPRNSIIKTLNIQNKERILKTTGNGSE
jgi:hypothetical protein